MSMVYGRVKMNVSILFSLWFSQYQPTSNMIFLEERNYSEFSVFLREKPFILAPCPVWKPRRPALHLSFLLTCITGFQVVELSPQASHLSKNSESTVNNARTKLEINNCSFVATGIMATVSRLSL